METIKAKHKVGDHIHVRLYYADDRAMFTHYGDVTGARLQKGTGLFLDRILYDLEMEQADGPNIIISNLSHGFVLAGGPEIEEEKNKLEEEAERRFPLHPNDPANRYVSNENADQITYQKAFLDGAQYQRQIAK